MEFVVFDGSPQSFDEHVVEPSALAVHADADAMIGETFPPGTRGELAALIGVKDLRRSTRHSHGLVKGLKTEARVERVGETPEITARVCQSMMATK